MSLLKSTRMPAYPIHILWNFIPFVMLQLANHVLCSFVREIYSCGNLTRTPCVLVQPYAQKQHYYRSVAKADDPTCFGVRAELCSTAIDSAFGMSSTIDRHSCFRL